MFKTNVNANSVFAEEYCFLLKCMLAGQFEQPVQFS